MKNRRPLVFGLLVLLAAGVGMAVLLTPRVRIDQVHCDLIRKGMTQAEVEAILGGPPGDYRSGDAKRTEVSYFPAIWNRHGPLFFDEETGTWRFQGICWTQNSGCIAVVFDPNGKVEAACFYRPLTGNGPSLVDKIRRWLGL